MRKILIYLYLALVLFLVILAITQSPSFVLFQIKNMSITMPLWLFIVFVAIFAYVVVLLHKAWRTLVVVPHKLKSNLARMRQRHEVKQQLRKIEKKIEKTKL